MPLPTIAQALACDGFALVAKQWNGQREVPGERNNPFVVECLQLVQRPAWARLGLLRDETPWCSAFAHRVLKECGLQGTGSAAARSWMKWGEACDKPVPGCVVVFSRPPLPGSGHVAFYDSQVGDQILVWGGNQKQRVCRAPYHARRLLGYRMPRVDHLPPELSDFDERPTKPSRRPA